MYPVNNSNDIKKNKVIATFFVKDTKPVKSCMFINNETLDFAGRQFKNGIMENIQNL